MRHHAFAIEAQPQKGIARAREYLERELGMHGADNPDIVVLTHGLFSVEDARAAAARALGAPLAGEHKAVIVAASRAYHEAQNALLKLFEEPPPGVVLFFIMPALGGLLPTLRSRVQVLSDGDIVSPQWGLTMSPSTDPVAKDFLTAKRERRLTIVKKLASGQDDEARRESRDAALALVNGIEAAAFVRLHAEPAKAHAKDAAELLAELATLRGYLHDRSAPLKQILEHLALVVPEDLL